MRRFAALRYFTPPAVDGFLADPIVRMRIGLGKFPSPAARMDLI